MALIENVQRKDLNPIDKAMAFKQLKEEFGLLDKENAQMVGSSRSSYQYFKAFSFAKRLRMR